MNFHVEYGFHPLTQARLFSRFSKRIKKEAGGQKVYLHPHKTFRLTSFAKTCLRRLKASSLYFFLSPEQISKRLISQLNRFANARVVIVVDAYDAPLSEAAKQDLLHARFPVVVNRCPEPVPGIKTHKDAHEEDVSAIQSILCYSGLHYGCEYSSCLGSTVFIDEKGDCRRCKIDVIPFGNLRQKTIADLLRQGKDLERLLEQEVAFRETCKKGCGYFSLCKGCCPVAKDRCAIKALLPEAEEANKKLSLSADNEFDRENAIYHLAFLRK